MSISLLLGLENETATPLSEAKHSVRVTVASEMGEEEVDNPSRSIFEQMSDCVLLHCPMLHVTWSQDDVDSADGALCSGVS